MRVFAWQLVIVLLIAGSGASGVGQLAGASTAGSALSLEAVARGFDRPVFVTHAGDGSGRLFVVEQPGTIRIVADGEVLDEPFLDISSSVRSSATYIEQGMLGLAFHPDFAANGYFYVSYTSAENAWTLARFQVSNNPDLADPSSMVPLIELPHPGNDHYGGMLQFGPDGYLYAGIGDGGEGLVTPGNSQDPSSLHGSILRIDVDRGQPYSIPPDNPYLNQPDVKPEIWSMGLRNPWRFSFDRLTGDLYISDVGEYAWEELNILPGGDPGGANFGWPVMEGNECFPPYDGPLACDPSAFTGPVYQYHHDQGCAMVGGHVYRGNPASPAYGNYLFGDYCSGAIQTLLPDGQAWAGGFELPTAMFISSFGEDEAGALYVADYDGGGIYRLNADDGLAQPALTNILPHQLRAGGVACRIGVLGAGFTEETIITWNGSPRPTTFRHSIQLSVELTMTDLSNAGVHQLAIEGDPGGTASGIVVVLSGDPEATQEIVETWLEADGSVADGSIQRTWLWGPSGLTCPVLEPYADAPGGARVVQYFDKTRMEITNPDGDRDSPWFTTNGLLVVELVTGNLQLGDATFEQRGPAGVNVAGDSDDPAGPTYQSFSARLNDEPAAVGSVIQQRIDRDGTVSNDATLAAYDITLATVTAETNHAIAEPFWQFMTAQDVAGGNPYYATGFPISEPYWATVTVGGVAREVLIQLFERQALTYTPDNAPAWRVESGNVGQHYFTWRYRPLGEVRGAGDGPVSP